MDHKLPPHRSTRKVPTDQLIPCTERKDVHWDFVLKEMIWLANDFQREKKRHIDKAKTISKDVKKYHETKETKVLKKSKDDAIALRKLSSKLSRDVRKFWLKINKLVAFKQKQEVDELKQKNMDRHLVFLVKQTERYTHMLTENMKSGGAIGQSTGSKSFSNQLVKKPLLLSNDEYNSDDYDELSVSLSTSSYNHYCSDAVSMEVEDDDDEFVAGEELDDETTLIQAEQEDGNEDRVEEITLLQQEQDIPIEKLRAMYANIPDDDDDEDEDDSDVGSVDSNSNQMQVDTSKSEEVEEDDDDDEDDVTPVSKGTEEGTNFNDALQRLEVADEIARSVHVELPFLLSRRLVLREYQHIGLNWLVSLHERRLNGILADEMGLGKTIQTIALLAYLAAFRGLWGPHLIIVPTSCIVNWETEFKRWCPNFKVITYYGSSKVRKNLRNGWSKVNSFHVCITSYQLVVQDANAFKRKRWYYMILDEAHNIKNFKSQRWQTLLNFNTQRRLLLTGTPLQNNLMELWSLMHFLMPHVFRSRKEFSYWFSNPLNSMVEGNKSVNTDLISRLHSIMRPFLLRRLKKDVAKQLPAKYEHVVMCKLSKRQLFLYEEFMSRSSTRSFLSGANFMGMMNILMQLRKVCNHPDLFEERAVTSSFVLEDIVFDPGAIFLTAMTNSPLTRLSTHLLSFWDYYTDSSSKDLLNKLDVSKDTFSSIVIEDLNLDSNGRRSKTSKHNSMSKYIELLDESVTTTGQQRLLFNYELNRSRCKASSKSINFNWRTTNIMRIVTTGQYLIESKYNAKFGLETSSVLIHLIKSLDDWLKFMLDVVERFVFVLPKVATNGPRLTVKGCAQKSAPKFTSLHVFDDIKNILYPISIRQKIFFPDRKLVQFDSGKLQTLHVLLRRLKKEGHKCLIFTQMSKMLDILEIFLNLHAHTYVRLDGSTGIDKRQKLMDRFNSDPKLFCFILSTRSGGLGINLTGADTVIFYDSDWNPAMDAQAQDRAHRIGQTKEVNIYRLVCSSTVEENILFKARQKRHLDYLVMTEGQFSESSLFNSSGLRDILAAGDHYSNAVDTSTQAPMQVNSHQVSAHEIEAAMVAAEDEADITAMKTATAEAANEAAEFDENAPTQSGDVDDDGNDIVSKSTTNIDPNATATSVVTLDASTEERDMEAEFASWQAKVGPDFKALENALKPIERFALRIRTEVEPYYSAFFFANDQLRLEAIQAELAEGEQLDVEEIEKQKEAEEYRALAEGELLAANLTRREIVRLKHWYLRERSQRNHARRVRLKTGASWSLDQDPHTGTMYWINNDTGEKRRDKPTILVEKESMSIALKYKYNALPHAILIRILSYLRPFPDRITCSLLCTNWHKASADYVFHKKVLPVESGSKDPTKRGNLAFGTYASIEEAVNDAVDGETIIVSSGHHWESNLVITKMVRLIGDNIDCARCIIELSGHLSVTAAAKTCLIGNLTIRRPKKIAHPTGLVSVKLSKLSVFNCDLNNDGCDSCALVAYNYADLTLFQCSIKGAISAILAKKATIIASNCTISNNSKAAIEAFDNSVITLDKCSISSNKHALFLDETVSTTLIRCDIRSSSDEVVQMTGPNSSFVTKKCTGDEPSSVFLSKFSYKSSHSSDHAPESIVKSDVDLSEHQYDTKKRTRDMVEFCKDYMYMDINSSKIVDTTSATTESISFSKKLKICL